MKCCRKNCEKESTVALKFRFRASPEDEHPTIGFVNLHTCDEHHLPDEGVFEMLMDHWGEISVAFEQNRKVAPNKDLTEFTWAPVEEMVEFFNIKGKNVQHLYVN